MNCGSIDDIQVDHIVPRSKSYWLRLSRSNLQIACGRCNKEKGVNTADYRPLWAKAKFHWRYTMKHIAIGFIIGYVAHIYISPSEAVSYLQHGLMWVSEQTMDEVM